ncbi:hypothetical protein V5799_024033 [Amblyomma americanum]|uniref:Uncharacterized protein n=1 Tax=Amblyomma americanum TaxID=6943 RepID=A0AAQ4EDS0_AMBAM
MTDESSSTGYGYTVCTIGHSGYSVAMFPIKEELCDYILFTHVYPSNDTLVSASGNVSYDTFIKVATKHRGGTRTMFGLSHSPHMLSSQLAQDGDGGTTARRFLLIADKVFNQTGLSAVGVMGLVRKAADFTKEMRLISWFKEHVFDFLVSGLKGEQEVEVVLSSTLVFVAYQMNEPVVKPVRFGERCVRNYLQSMEAYCLQKLLNEEEDADSVTAVAFNGDTLFSFETPKTVENKMRRFVFALDDKVYRRVGWAFFDLAFEIYNEALCPVKSNTSNKFSRVAVAKPILEENRKRKFD